MRKTENTKRNSFFGYEDNSILLILKLLKGRIKFSD